MNEGSDKTGQNNKLAELEASLTTKRTSSSTTASRKKSEKGTAQSNPKPKTVMLWALVVLNFAILACALAGAWYFVYPKYQSQQMMEADYARLKQRMQAQEQDLSQTKLALTNQQQKSEKLAQQSTAEINALANQAKENAQSLYEATSKLESLDGRRPADWLIAEADYLVRMAGRKVWLEKDTRTAIMLLANADQRLSELADPSLLPVRSLIAEDIQTLRQANPVSLTSIALALNGLTAKVNSLPLNTIQLPDLTQAEQDTEVSDSIADWRANLSKAWDDFTSKFIRLRHREAPVEPMITQAQEWLAKEQLKLQLQTAQSAALKAQPTLYQAALDQALTIIHEQFDTQTPQVQGYINGINQLKSSDVAEVLPSELASQSALTQLLESRVNHVFGQGANAL